MNDRDERQRMLFSRNTAAGRGMMISSNFIAGMGVLGYGGYWLDNRFEKAPLFTVIGLLLGLTWALYEAIKLANGFAREDSAFRKAIQEEKTEANDDKE